MNPRFLSGKAARRRPCRLVLALGLCAFLAAHVAADATTTAADIARLRVFQEPLVPIGGEPSEAENAALARSLQTYARRAGPDDFSALEAFAEAHPRSAWLAALLTGLGTEYYRTGHYSRVLPTFSRAWELSRSETEPRAKAMADRVVGELAMMLARLGRADELDKLLAGTKDRVIVGSASERISGARQGLDNMRHRPEIAFRCGPLALHRIQVATAPTRPMDELVLATVSTTNGLSLVDVADLSRRMGMNYRMARRTAGSTVLLPAVVHWKVGHYAALIRREGDRYLVQDPTFYNDAWISQATLEEESSGFFLVPPGQLPAGWREATPKEGAGVWGKGSTTSNDPGPHAPGDPRTPPPSCDSPRGLAVPSVHLMTVNLHFDDEPVGYQPPLGPSVNFTVRYNHRDAFQPAIFSYSNLGAKWTCDWIAFITDNPFSPSADVQYYVMGGGLRTFVGFNPETRTFAFQQYDQTRLTRTAPDRYEMVASDGSRRVFGRSDGSFGTSRRLFLSEIVDPAGNAVQLAYDDELRLVSITDAIGQITTLAYGLAADRLKITRVTDPFGRAAQFDYDGGGRLIRITDVLGMASVFGYDGASEFIASLTTPYGATSFSRGESGTTRWLETVFPDGERERVEYNQTVNLPQSEPAALVPAGMSTVNAFLAYRNTYYWSKVACSSGYGDYSKARIYHWLHTIDLASTAGILESTKDPLESRIWHNYPGQTVASVVGTSSQPSRIGRVLEDGSTQLRTFEYNGFGRVTKAVDPLGRTLSYVYSDDGLDLLEIRETRAGNNVVLSRASFNALHQPLTEVDAAGQTNSMTYDARGLLTSRTNARGETTHYQLDAQGRLTAVDGPLPGNADSEGFTYDAAGRVRTQTSVDGDTRFFDFDAFDRPTRITHPDGTFETTAYDRLDRVTRTDRAGRVRQFEHDPIRHEGRRIDPLGREMLTQWCGCGSQKSLTDAMGRTTRWEHDLQGRVMRKEYPDGSSVRYVYERNTSRLFQVIDEKGQVREYAYNRDDTVRSISYPVALVPTPAVRFEYDLNHVRVVSMTDGIGETRYSYVPYSTPPVPGAGQIARIDGPWPGVSVTYAYDELGRVTSRAINGVATHADFDAAGRATTITNALGVFPPAYDGVTTRVLSISHGGGFVTSFHYLGASGDRLPDRITHALAGSPISEFVSTWNVARRRIEGWSQQAGTSPAKLYAFEHDAADQLTNAVLTQAAATLRAFAWQYDAAGNRRAEHIDGATTVATFNVLNQAVGVPSGAASGTTYEWDAEQRMVAIQRPGNLRTEFRYDGKGRRVQIRELANGIETRLRRFVSADEQLVEERDGAGSVVRRFFPEGVKIEIGPDAGIYLYARDHLNSVREVVDAAGAVRARYEYDPYGRSAKIEGDLESDFGYTGHLVHAPTGLLLPRYREYDPGLGRWLSRDPMPDAELRIGPNFYQYVGNSPVNRVDPMGLDACAVCDLAKKRGLLAPTIAQFTPICYQGRRYECPNGGKPSEGESAASQCAQASQRRERLIKGDNCPSSGGPTIESESPSFGTFARTIGIGLLFGVFQTPSYFLTSDQIFRNCIDYARGRCRTAKCLEDIDRFMGSK